MALKPAADIFRFLGFAGCACCCFSAAHLALCSGGNPGAGRFAHRAALLLQQGRDGLLLLAAEFCAVSLHLPQPEGLEPRPGFSKATVNAWRVTLDERGLGSSSIIVRMSAIRKLAVEAIDNGLLAPELAAGIQRVKSAKSIGVRMRNWLSLKQAQTLLNAPDITTVKGMRDRAIIAVLLGCGLRRSEVAALTMGHIQQRDGRWCIVDLPGKHGRVRTVPMPAWMKGATDAWTSPAGVTDGRVFRPVQPG